MSVTLVGFPDQENKTLQCKPENAVQALTSLQRTRLVGPLLSCSNSQCDGIEENQISTRYCKPVSSFATLRDNLLQGGWSVTGGQIGEQVCICICPCRLSTLLEMQRTWLCPIITSTKWPRCTLIQAPGTTSWRTLWMGKVGLTLW